MTQRDYDLALLAADAPPSATGYTTRGSVRGSCSHVHRTAEAAAECLLRDRSSCKKVGGYSDRRIVPMEET